MGLLSHLDIELVSLRLPGNGLTTAPSVLVVKLVCIMATFLHVQEGT